MRMKPSIPTLSAQPGGDRRDLALWLVVTGIAGLSFLLASQYPWLHIVDEGAGLPIPDLLDTGMDWFVSIFKGPFRVFAWLMEWPVYGLRNLYLWLPWPFIIFAVMLTGYTAAGWRLALFCGGALGFTLLAGFWSKAVLTLALVSVSLPLSVLTGIVIGIWGHRNARTREAINAILDFMQTIPAFAYLIPCLILFGFGPTVGLIASAIFAIPPMSRNVMLGLSRVSSETIESAVMSGATPRQLLWLVKIPSAMPTLMIGLNQTILATLSMVVIAAVLGSGEDLGWEVLDKMRRAEFGKSLMAGVAIVLLAMLMDRVTQAFAMKRAGLTKHRANAHGWRNAMLVCVAVLAATLMLGEFVPFLRTFPEDFGIAGAERLDDVVSWINRNHPDVTTAIKDNTLFYFLLPLKIGLDDVVRPFSWGFELTTVHRIGYAVAVLACAAAATALLSWRLGLAIGYLGVIVYVGITNLPWPAFVAPVCLLAWQVGGWRIGMFAALSLLFILACGFWTRAMISVYLCGSAVLLCMIFGFVIGVAAALNDRVSRIVRPINDTLQSIPLFVFLIPVVSMFKVGEFAGLLAIIMYAIVPVIRYTEHGIRNVSREVVEAAQVMGSTRRQLLTTVQLPLALPEIMLGVNQTVLFGLAMLVVTALIGTKGLGQVIYQSLSIGGFGLGICAGLSMAFIAMITDRIIQTWSRRKKEEFGL